MQVCLVHLWRQGESGQHFTALVGKTARAPARLAYHGKSLGVRKLAVSIACVWM